jgi:membrane-associated phospholipid phosphatase
MQPRFSSHYLCTRAVVLVVLHLLVLVPARADSPLLNRGGHPNGLFWATGAATLALDEPLYDQAQRLDSPAAHRAAVAFNNFGDARAQLGAFGLLALVGGGTDKRIARRGLHGMVAVGLAVFTLKNVTRKSRPWAGRGPVYGAGKADAEETRQNISLPGELDGHTDSNMSFPSGHTAAAFSLATIWAHERPRDRELAYGLATLVGVSRLLLKQHWPSDVFWGGAIGAAAGNAALRDVPFGLMFRIR